MPHPTTHAHRGDLAVFLIGLRINKLHRPDAWMPAVAAMPRMLTELYTNKATSQAGDGDADPWLGFYDARTVVGVRGPTVVQYWRSVADIYAYAGAESMAHRPAWKEFYARARSAQGAVGVWHETFAVPAGGHESLYLDMPAFGLGRATGVVDAHSKGRSARERLTASQRSESKGL